MITFKLKLEDEQELMSFNAQRLHSSTKFPISSNVIPCVYRYVDRTVLDMIFNSENLLYSSTSFVPHPDDVESLSTLVKELQGVSSCLRFIYTANSSLIPPDSLPPNQGPGNALSQTLLATGVTSTSLAASPVASSASDYLLHCEYKTDNPNIIGMIKLIKLTQVDEYDDNLQVLDSRIMSLKLKHSELEESKLAQVKEIELKKAEIDRYRRDENKLSTEVDRLHRKITDIKEQLTNNTRVEEMAKEQLADKERYSKILAGLNKEHATKRKELLDSLAKRYEILRDEMLADVNNSLHKYIEDEKRLKSTLRAAIQKQTNLDNIRKLVINLK